MDPFHHKAEETLGDLGSLLERKKAFLEGKPYGAPLERKVPHRFSRLNASHLSSLPLTPSQKHDAYEEIRQVEESSGMPLEIRHHFIYSNTHHARHNMPEEWHADLMKIHHIVMKYLKMTV